MGGFFLFILIVFFIIFLLGGTFLRGIVQFMFKRSASSFSNFNRQTYNKSRQDNKDQYSQSSQGNASRREHKKIFSKNEGEYVDFEEIR